MASQWRRTALALLAAAALPLAALRAQGAPRLELGAEATYWRFGTGVGAAATRWGPTARIGTRGGPLSGFDVTGSLSYAPQGSVTPGLAGGALELTRFLLGEAPSRPLRPFVRAGLAVLDFATDNLEGVIRGCTAETGCMYEGPSPHGGLQVGVLGGLGLDLGLTPHLSLQPLAQALLMDGPAGPSSVHWRIGLGAAWH